MVNTRSIRDARNYTSYALKLRELHYAEGVKYGKILINCSLLCPVITYTTTFD